MSEISTEKQNKKTGLGRGLGSLLGGANDSLSQPISKSLPTQNAVATAMNIQNPVATQIPNEARIWQIAVDKLVSGEFQPRTEFDKEKIAELAASIKEHGILQPIVARKLGTNNYEIVAGERRWRAAQVAGLHQVPVILKEMADQKALEIALIENIQREDLNPIEEAEAYQKLSEEFNLTQQQVAEKVGKERATVANSLRLLLLPTPLREMLKKSEITTGHAKVLLSINDPKKQLEFAQAVRSEKVSVRQLEKMAAALNHKPAESAKLSIDNNVTDRLIAGLAEELQKLMATKVAIDYKNSKGKISIHFYSDEELTQIVDRLKESHGKH